MPPEIVYNREQRRYEVNTAASTPPVQPDPETPPAEVPPEDGEPQPEGTEIPPDTGTGETPPEGQLEEEVEEALTNVSKRRQRPFVQRLIENAKAAELRLAQAEARNAILMEQLQRGAGGAAPHQLETQPATPQPGQRPKVPVWEEYGGNVEAFTRAQEDYWGWISEQRAQKVLDAFLQQQATQSAQQEREMLNESLRRKIREGETKYDDFQEALETLDAELGRSDLYPVVQRVAAHSDRGAELLRYLAQHPEVLRELHYRNPRGAEAYLSQLDAQLGGKPPPATRQRPAPPGAPNGNGMPPVRPLNGAAGTGQTTGSRLADIANSRGSMREYIHQWNQERGQRR